jgi:hypothetical protein
MPKYVIVATPRRRVPESLGPQEYAASHGFSCETLKSGWRFSGSVTPFNATALIDHLVESGSGYAIFEKPRLLSLSRMPLADICLSRGQVSYSEEKALIGQVIGGERVADLSRCSFSEIMDRERHVSGFLTLPHLTAILRFMVDYDISFQDMSPREVFQTPIGYLDLPTRFSNIFLRNGFRWAELFQYVASKELRGISRMGPKALRQLQDALARHNMNFLY